MTDSTTTDHTSLLNNTSSTPGAGRDQYEALDRPLFGESSRTDRLINLIVGTVTAVLVIITLISAFVWPVGQAVNGMNVYFAICILLILFSHILLIFWYRQGDLEPKFRTMIYYNAFTLVLLCICANLYIHKIDDESHKKS